LRAVRLCRNISTGARINVFLRGRKKKNMAIIDDINKWLANKNIAQILCFLADWIDGHAPQIYLVYALPLILFLSLAMPPLSAPDEWDHTARALNIAQGHMAPSVSKDGKLVSSLGQNYQAVVLDSHAALWKNHRWSWAPFMSHLDDPWGDSFLPANYASQGYFPLGYVPQIIFLCAARMAKWPIVSSLRWGRLFMGALYCLGAAALLAWARSARVALLMVLGCPLSLFLFASFSPDPLILLLTTFIAIGLARYWNQSRIPRHTVFLVLLAAFVICSLKIVYLPVFMLLLVGFRKAIFKSPATALFAGGAIFAALSWNAIYVQPPDRLAAGIDPAAQLHFLMADPLVVFPVAMHTLEVTKLKFLFDWFNFTKVHWPELSPSVIVIMLSGMALIFIMDPLRVAYSKKEAGSWSFASVLLTTGLSFAALYLAWTKVGSMGAVQGFQGRYLLPLLPLLLLTAGLLPSWPQARQAVLCLVTPLWLAGCAVITVWIATSYVLPYYP